MKKLVMTCAMLLVALRLSARVFTNEQESAEMLADSAAKSAALMLRTMERIEKCAVQVEDGKVVGAVYREGTNSTFITRTDLTATQKRFIALDRLHYATCLYIAHLESRVAALEAKEDRLERRRAEAKARAESRRQGEGARRTNMEIIRKSQRRVK